MKKPVLFFLITLSVCFAAGLRAEAQNLQEQKLAARIANVKVYQNQAQVFRKGAVLLNPGRYKLVVEGLSLQMDPNTVQVEGKGGGIIGSVTPRRTYLNQQPKPKRLRLVEDSLELVSRKIETFDNEEYAFNQQKELLLANKTLTGTDENLTMEQLKAMADFFQTRLHAVQKELSRLKYAKQELNEIAGRLRNELNQLNQRRNQATYVVEIQFESKRRANVELIVKYLVNNAGWSPKYLIRADGINEPVQFDMQAAVYNRTGTDWDNVKLELSTAQPRKNVTPPTLQPWRNAVVPPGQVAMESRKRLGAAAPTFNRAETKDASADDQAGYDMYADETSDFAQDFTTFTSNTLAQEFAINLAYNIPADGQAYDVKIRSVDAKAEFAYFSVPKLNDDVYLQAKIAAGQGLNLLPGPAQVYFEGGFVGRTSIQPFMAEDTLKIGLGTDERVVVERKMDDQYSKSTTFGKNRKLERGYEIKVLNQKNRTVNIVVEDQIPLEERSEIDVDLLEKSGAEYDEKTGKLTWRMELRAGESKTVRFAFEIKYPENWELVGF